MKRRAFGSATGGNPVFTTISCMFAFAAPAIKCFRRAAE
jgi:hypothetical protein